MLCETPYQHCQVCMCIFPLHFLKQTVNLLHLDAYRETHFAGTQPNMFNMCNVYINVRVYLHILKSPSNATRKLNDLTTLQARNS